LGKIDIVLKKCKRIVLNETFEPIWIRSPDSSYWMYSVSASQQVTVQCQQTGSPANPKASYQMVIERTVILPISTSSCVHAENFKLLPNSLRKTTVNLTKAPIVLPNVQNILHFSEEYLLQTEIRHSTELKHLDVLWNEQLTEVLRKYLT
jgi:hypothetical protein